MGKNKYVKFPGVLNYSILVAILGVVWSDPMDVVNKSEIGKVFDPWFISIIPLVLCISTIIASYLKDMSVTVANKGLIGVDIMVFVNSIYLLYSGDYRTFIIISVITSVLFMIFGKAYGIKIKDIISKLYPNNYLEYQARSVRYDGIIKFLVLLISFAINMLWVKDGYYEPIIYYSLFLGIISISYEIWFMRPLKYMNTRYERLLKRRR